MRVQVLAVEPSRDVAARLATIFDPTHYALMWAADLTAGRTALSRVGRLGLVVLEATLPDGDGLDLCRQMKRLRPSLPIAVLTAEAAARDAVRAAGADLFMTKPFDAEAFRDAALRLLGAAPRPLAG